MNTSSVTTGTSNLQDVVQLTRKGGQLVAAIQPTSDALSSADERLLAQVAMGGTMQLQVSQAALEAVTGEEARTLAQAEVEEQTGISEKLQEIAAAKGISLPTLADPQTEELLAGLAGADDADTYYITTSGVQGHQKLMNTMTMVQQQAEDQALLELANAALPVIQAHLQAAQQAQGSTTA